jgi:hypothetical protein
VIGKAGPIIPAVAASAERIERVHSDDKCDSHASDRPEFGRIEQRVQPQFADVRLGVVKRRAAMTQWRGCEHANRSCSSNLQCEGNSGL